MNPAEQLGKRAVCRKGIVGTVSAVEYRADGVLYKGETETGAAWQSKDPLFLGPVPTNEQVVAAIKRCEDAQDTAAHNGSHDEEALAVISTLQFMLGMDMSQTPASYRAKHLLVGK